MAPGYQAPPGTLDILPPASARFEELVGRFAGHVGRAGYGLIVGPAFEDVAVYERVGETTDIVGKEMYDFRDKGDRHLALRPDSTPSVVRAFVHPSHDLHGAGQQRPALPWKVWYLAPHFRYDRQQRWRYRQHHSLGVECLGTADPDLDVEVVALAAELLSDVGLSGWQLLLNSIGDPECRPAYREALLSFLLGREHELCDEHQKTFRGNPMRVLDCKREQCRSATEAAPRILDHLCGPCADHFAHVREGLDAWGIPYTIQTRLVRGQDYYTRTTFEIEGAGIGGLALGGGGRYDGLVEASGGPPTPGIGFGLGIERILAAADLEGALPGPASALDAFVVDTTGGGHARQLCRELRAAGLRADRAFDGRSMKAQLKAADRSGAPVALILGDDEVAAGEVTAKDLRTGEQRRLPRHDVVRVTRESR